MKKMFSLIKACMTDNMSLFRIKSKDNNKKSKLILPVFLFVFIFVYMMFYANMIITPLKELNLEYILLTLFILFTTIITLIEGIYKSSSLLFNCKDDDLLLSLPIQKSTVLFIRVFKFYIFELMYNSLFLVPAMLVYAFHVNITATYYIVSLAGILLLPIIPIVISSIIGGIISFFSSKFKYKNIAQTLITLVMVLGIFYLTYNIENFINNLSQNALTLNEIVTKIYYPAGVYINLIINYSINDFIIFIFMNIIIFILAIVLFSKMYYRINSNSKIIQKTTKNINYNIKANTPIKSLIKKEFNRFINSPVFVINSGIGMVLYFIGCILICVKYNDITNSIIQTDLMSLEQINNYIPAILFGFICISSLLSSITSSMISLEGKSFNILKSLPIKPFIIVQSKILTAIIIMLPCIILGDIIAFVRFDFNIFEIIMILITSIILPLFTETIGIIVNLKYPKMNAENDTEVVKQSMSTSIAVLVGMILSGLTIFFIIKCFENNINTDFIILAGLSIYTIMYSLLLLYLNKNIEKDFNKIIV